MGALLVHRAVTSMVDLEVKTSLASDITKRTSSTHHTILIPRVRVQRESTPTHTTTQQIRRLKTQRRTTPRRSTRRKRRSPRRMILHLILTSQVIPTQRVTILQAKRRPRRSQRTAKRETKRRSRDSLRLQRQRDRSVGSPSRMVLAKWLPIQVLRRVKHQVTTLLISWEVLRLLNQRSSKQVASVS